MSPAEHSLEIGGPRLAAALEAGEPIQVLDVRAPHRLAAGVVEPVPEGRYHNVPGSQVVRLPNAADLGLDRAHPVTVVCSRGNDSLQIAALLAAQGFRATSLRGGIHAWMRMVLPREIPSPDGFTRLVQFDRPGKGALGYLLVQGAKALAIDPPRDWEPFAEEALRSGARVAAVADTHAHADYLSGGPAMAAALGIPYHLHPADTVSPYDGAPGRLDVAPLADGGEIQVGDRAVTVLHTPGHTEGSVTYRTGDGAAFTGDFLFVRSIGRPDLAGKTGAWSGDLWRSLARARATWPHHMRIYPAHYTGDDERNEDRTVGRPLGRLLAQNEPLTISDEEAFRRWVAERVSPAPEAYRRIKEVNLGLQTVDEEEADELEAGKSECALG